MRTGTARATSARAGLRAVFRLTARYVTAVSDAAGAYTLSGNVPFFTVSLSFPSGSWPTAGWFRRVERGQEGGVDFGLHRQEQPLPFAFVQMTDPHGAHPLTLPQVLGECKGLPLDPKLHVCTGDMRSGSPTVRDLPDLERTFGGMARTFGGFGAPLFMVPGNHDTVEFDFRQAEPLAPERTAHPLFGNGCWECYVCPSYWSFSYGGVHFVALPYAGYVDGRWSNLLPQVERWLQEDLKAAAGERGRALRALPRPGPPDRSVWPGAGPLRRLAHGGPRRPRGRREAGVRPEGPCRRHVPGGQGPAHRGEALRRDRTAHGLPHRRRREGPH